MGFKVNSISNRADESSNKTLRLKNDMIKTLEGIADKNNISFNKLVVQMLEYCISNLED